MNINDSNTIHQNDDLTSSYRVDRGLDSLCRIIIEWVRCAHLGLLKLPIWGLGRRMSLPQAFVSREGSPGSDLPIEPNASQYQERFIRKTQIPPKAKPNTTPQKNRPQGVPF